MLISFGGLPGVGKSTITAILAERLGAVRLRVDVIEQALRDMGLPVNADEGYRVAHAVALDNLRLGRTVISDCVNPIAQSREAWRLVAQHAPAAFVEVEIICSNRDEHKRRVETRTSDIPNLKLPDWIDVQRREREPWTREHLVFDSAKLKPEEIVDMLGWPLERAKRAFEP